MNEYLSKLYDWISSQDPTFQARRPKEEFISKMENDADYNQQMYTWISGADATFTDRYTPNAFQEKTGLKKKDDPVDSTSQEVDTDSISQPQQDLGSSESFQAGTDEQISGIKAYFDRRDLDADEVNRDPNIQAAIKAGIITEQDLVAAGYKQPKQVDVLSQPNQQRVQYAKNKISALRIKTQEEMDLAIQQRRLDTPYAYEGSASEDTFVDDLYGSSMLALMNINPKDFDGFLEERGFKKDFLDKKERGLFERTYGSGGDPELSYEVEKMRMLNLYVSNQLDRDIEFQKIRAQKETGIDPDFEGKQYRPSEGNVNLNMLTQYVESEMPLVTKKLKERDAKNRETYVKHINGEMGVGNFVANIATEGWRGFSDRVNELSASAYGSVGMSNVSDAIRLATDVDKLTRTDNLSYGYASGKTTEYNGKKYLVDGNNQVYDIDSKIRVTQFLDEGTYKEIVSKAKSLGYDDQTFSATGTAYQTSNVLGDLVVQIALTRGTGTIMSSAGGFTRGLNILNKTKGILSKVPVSREMSSAIIAQATMGASSGYERTLRLAKDSGLNETQARELASYSSSQMAVLYALTAPISPQTKATEALFGNVRNVAIKDAVEAYKNMGLQGARGVFEKYGKMVLNYGGEGLKELGQENIQQAGEAFVVNANVNEEAGIEIARDTITMDEFVNTSIISFLAGGLMPAAGATVDAARRNTRKMLGLEGIDRIKALDHLARNEQKVVDLLNDQVDRGLYTMEAATDLLSEINTYKQNIGKIPTGLKPETALDIMGEIEQIRALESKRDQLDPIFHDGINQDIEKIKESIKKKVEQDAVQEQETGDIPDVKPAEAVQEVEEEVREPSVTERKPQTVNDLINRPVTLTKLGGTKLDTPVEGDLFIDGQQVVVEDADGKIIELGNVDELSGQNASDLGIEFEVSEVSVTPEGNIQIDKDQYTIQEDLPTQGIEYNEDGTIKSVSIKKGDKPVEFRGQTAIDLGYQILLKEAQSPEQEQRINELLDKDEEFQNELRQVEAATQAEADQDTEQAVERDEDYSKSPIVVRSRPKTATEEPVILSGVEAEAADRTIEKIVNDGIAKGQSTQEILDRILPRYAFNDIEINRLRDFVEGKRSGKTNTDFAAYKKGAPVVEEAVQEEVEIMTEPATIKNAPKGTYLNVGMIEGKDGREMTEDEIESALPEGVEIQVKTRLEIGEGVEEPTLSLQVSRPLTPAEMKAFRTATGQMAVPQMTDGVGTMYGTTDWGPFNPEFFIMPDKRKLSQYEPMGQEVQKLRDIFKAPDQRSQVEAAEKALSKVAPDVKIIVHKDEDSYAKATGEEGRKQKSGGEYNHRTKTIHINPAKANARTVAHEAFHAILLNMIGTDADIQRITKAMINAVAKSASPELKAALDRFAANYDENIQNEEKLAELIGMIAANHAKLSKPTQNVIKRWMDRLAKMFGLKPFTDAEVVDVLNLIGKKIATGEAISDEDVSIIDRREISDRTARMSRKQLQDLFLSDEKPNLKSTKDVAKFLDAWTKESAVFEDDVKNISDREIVDRFVDHLTLELQAWEKVRKDDYISFYDEDVVKNTNPTLQQYAKKEYGRELTDTEVKLYHLVSAFASPSANPEMDSWKGFDIFDRFMKTGELSGYSDKVATVWKTLPGGKRVDTGVPRVDEKGMPVRSKVTPAYSQTGLDKFNLVIEKMDGDIDAAMDWITSRHTYDEIADMFGYPKKGAKAMKENEYMSKEDGGIGVFGMTGAKLGSYILNRFGNFSTVTKDMWYARTMARLAGEDLVSVNKATGKEGAIKTPWSESTKQGRRMRSLADQAFKKVGDLFDTSPAMVQERIWDFEKRLYEMLGANEDAAYTSDGLKKGIERAKDVKPRKQIEGVDPADIVRRGREEGLSDESIRKFLDQEGYADFEIPSRATVGDLRKKSESELAAKVKKKSARFISRMIREKILDRQTRVKDLIKGIGSKDAGRAANLLVTKSGGTGYANFRFKKAEKDIYGSLSENEINELNEIIYAQRIISINEKREQAGRKKYKGAEGYNEAAARRDIADAKTRLGEDKFNDLKSRADRYFKEFDQSLDRGFEAGIISEDAYNNFKNVEYSPIRTIKYLVPDDYDGAAVDRMTNITGMNQDMIKRLSDENVNSVIMDSRWLLMTNIAMIEGRVFENRMLNAFNDAVENATKEEKEAFAEDILENPRVGTTKTGKPVYKYDKVKVPPGFTTIEFIKDGQKRNIVIRKTYASQLLDIKTQPSLMEKGLSKLTGVDVLRFLATSGNPFFIVTNTPIDFANILFLSDVYSNNKFLGGAKLAFDAVSTFTRKMVSDAASRLNISKKMAFDRMYQEFMEHGGAMDYLSMDGMKAISGKKGSNLFEKGSLGLMRGIGGVLSYLGESSEITFRLAVFEKSKQNQIKQFKKDNGRDPDKQEMEDIMFAAAREARETIDFAQGGSAIKSADRMLPYLNAATQGFRKGFDYALNNPGKFALSAVQAMTMAGSIAALSLFNLFRGMDDDDEKRVLDILDSVSEYEKANYHIVFTGKKNEDGEFEYYRIKKLPTISVFTTMAEQMAMKSILKSKGVKYDVDGDAMSKAVDASTPIIPIDEIARIVRGKKSKSGAPMIVDVPMKILNRNPLLAGVLSYSYNYDHFYGAPIFNAPRNYKIDPTAEGIYDDRVNQIYKDLAPYFNMSPKRTKAMLEKIITSETTNPIVGLIYSGYDVLAKDDATVGEEIDKAMESLKKNATKKTTRYTNKNLLMYKDRDEAEREEIGIETKKYLAEQKVYNQIRKRYVDEKGTMDSDEFADIIMKNFDRYDWKRYAKKYRAYIRNINVDKSILDIVFEDTPEVQAYMIYKKFGDSFEEDEIEMIRSVYSAARRKFSKKGLYIYNTKYRK
jgi:hypothetical protein